MFVDMVKDDEVPCYDAVGNDSSFKEMPKVTFTERRRSATPNRWSNDEVRVVSCPSHPCNNKLIMSRHPSRFNSHCLTSGTHAMRSYCRSYSTGVNLRVMGAFVIIVLQQTKRLSYLNLLSHCFQSLVCYLRTCLLILMSSFWSGCPVQDNSFL